MPAPPATRRRAYDADGRAIPPMTLGNGSYDDGHCNSTPAGSDTGRAFRTALFICAEQRKSAR